jgi:hypothetical protein
VDYKKYYGKYIGLMIQEANKIQDDMVNEEKHIERAKAYSAIANTLFDARSMLFDMEENEKEVSKEDLKNSPVEEPEAEKLDLDTGTVMETVPDNPAEVENPISKPREKGESVENPVAVFNEVVTQLNEWIDSEAIDVSVILFWASQATKEEITDLSELDSYPENVKADFIEYIHKWMYLLTYWAIDDVLQILSYITKDQLNNMEDITPDNIDALVTYTNQRLEEPEAE